MQNTETEFRSTPQLSITHLQGVYSGVETLIKGSIRPESQAYDPFRILLNSMVESVTNGKIFASAQRSTSAGGNKKIGFSLPKYQKMRFAVTIRSDGLTFSLETPDRRGEYIGVAIVKLSENSRRSPESPREAPLVSAKLVGPGRSKSKEISTSISTDDLHAAQDFFSERYENAA